MGNFGAGMLQVMGGAIQGAGAGYSSFVDEQSKFDKQTKLDNAQAARAKDLAQYTSGLVEGRAVSAEGRAIAAEKRGILARTAEKEEDLGFAKKRIEMGEEIKTTATTKRIGALVDNETIPPEAGEIWSKLATAGFTLEEIMDKPGKLSAGAEEAIIKAASEAYPGDMAMQTQAIKAAKDALTTVTKGWGSKAGAGIGEDEITDIPPAMASAVDETISSVVAGTISFNQAWNDAMSIPDESLKQYTLNKLSEVKRTQEGQVMGEEGGMLQTITPRAKKQVMVPAAGRRGASPREFDENEYPGGA